MDARIPTFSLDRVFHVGTMDPSRVGENSPSGSHEGTALSVSVCPNAWAEIARIGDDAFELSRPGGSFLDVVSVRSDEALLAAIVEWAKAEGLVVPSTAWHSWFEDDDGWRYFAHATLESAMAEASDEGDYESPEDVPGPDGRPGVVMVSKLAATPALVALTGIRDGLDDATDSAVVAWAMTVPAAGGTPLDGVWWTETYDPPALSAPRGAIFAASVPSWSARVVDLADVDDDGEVFGFPREAESFRGP